MNALTLPVSDHNPLSRLLSDTLCPSTWTIRLCFGLVSCSRISLTLPAISTGVGSGDFLSLSTSLAGRTESAGLSVRSLRNIGIRKRPSRVHSLNLTSITICGFTQVNLPVCSGSIAKGLPPITMASSRFLSFPRISLSNPLPTLPAYWRSWLSS